MRLRQLLLLGLTIGLLVVASDALFWFRTAASRFAGLGQSVGGATSEARGFFGTLADIESLRDRVTALEAENAALRNTAVVADEAELGRSLDELQLVAARPFGDALAVRVIHRSPSLFLDTLVVDHGTNDKLAVGNPVLVNGSLAGVVEQVEAKRATVQLITSARSVVPVRLQHSRAQGLLRGGLGGMVVTDLPGDVVVEPGEPVLTSGLGETLPAGLPVGRSGDRLSDESEILQRASMLSPVPFGNLEVLAVVRTEVVAQ